MRVLSLDHIHVYARDPEATIAFFVGVLGGERIGSIPAGDARRNDFVILGGQILAISAFPADTLPGPPPKVGNGAVQRGHGVAHLGLNVDDIDAYVRRIEEAGLEVHDPVRDAGVLRYAYFTGPDGLVIELTQYELPARFRPAIAALGAMNRLIHRTRRAVTSTLLRFAPTG